MAHLQYALKEHTIEALVSNALAQLATSAAYLPVVLRRCFPLQRQRLRRNSSVLVPDLLQALVLVLSDKHSRPVRLSPTSPAACDGDRERSDLRPGALRRWRKLYIDHSSGVSLAGSLRR